MKPKRRFLGLEDLRSELARATGLPRTVCARVLDALIERVSEELAGGSGVVKLWGLGIWETRMTGGGAGYDFTRGTRFTRAPRRVVRFRASARLRERVASAAPGRGGESP